MPLFYGGMFLSENWWQNPSGVSIHIHIVQGCSGEFPLLSSGMMLLFACFSLQKHAYSNIMKILPPKNENFQIKNSEFFHISAQNIDCGYLFEPPR